MSQVFDSTVATSEGEVLFKGTDVAFRKALGNIFWGFGWRIPVGQCWWGQNVLAMPPNLLLESSFQTCKFWPLSSKSTTKHLVSPSKTSYQISIITPTRWGPHETCREVTPEQIKKAMESQMAEDDQKLYEVRCCQGVKNIPFQLKRLSGYLFETVIYCWFVM